MRSMTDEVSAPPQGRTYVCARKHILLFFCYFLKARHSGAIFTEGSRGNHSPWQGF